DAAVSVVGAPALPAPSGGNAVSATTRPTAPPRRSQTRRASKVFSASCTRYPAERRTRATLTRTRGSPSTSSTVTPWAHTRRRALGGAVLLDLARRTVSRTLQPSGIGSTVTRPPRRCAADVAVLSPGLLPSAFSSWPRASGEEGSGASAQP